MVTELSAQGWELWGNPFCCGNATLRIVDQRARDTEYMLRYCQAVVRHMDPQQAAGFVWQVPQEAGKMVTGSIMPAWF